MSGAEKGRRRETFKKIHHQDGAGNGKFLSFNVASGRIEKCSVEMDNPIHILERHHDSNLFPNALLRGHPVSVTEEFQGNRDLIRSSDSIVDRSHPKSS